jgi:hypothetical protein
MIEDDYELMYPVEHSAYPGFFHVPGFYPTGISKDGRVMNFHTGNQAKCHINNVGYISTSISYMRKEFKLSIHRLIGLTFIGRPKRHLDKLHCDLEINHKDGIKLHNEIKNLEWLTSKENMHHAIIAGLMNGNCVLSRNILTNELKEHITAYECAREFQIDGYKLRDHLVSNKAGTRTKDWCVFKLDNGSPWPEILPKHSVENSLMHGIGFWIATNIETDQKVLHNTLNDLCGALCLSYGKVSNHYFRNKDMCYDGWKFKHHNETPSEYIALLPSCRPRNSAGVPIKMTHLITGVIKEFKDMNSLVADTKITISTLLYALAKKDGILNNTYRLEKIL